LSAITASNAATQGLALRCPGPATRAAATANANSMPKLSVVLQGPKRIIRGPGLLRLRHSRQGMLSALADYRHAGEVRFASEAAGQSSIAALGSWPLL